jgi:hypothetical protein
MVRFLEDPEQYKTCEMIEHIDSSIHRYDFGLFKLSSLCSISFLYYLIWQSTNLTWKFQMKICCQRSFSLIIWWLINVQNNGTVKETNCDGRTNCMWSVVLVQGECSIVFILLSKHVYRRIKFVFSPKNESL